MSGIEIVGLAFGVVPVVVETLKSYSYLKDKLHTCRHYSDEVEEVAARLAGSRTNFNNEIQLLRRSLKNERQAPKLDDDVEDALQESFRSCIKTIERIKKILGKMDTDMAKLDELFEKKSQVSSCRGPVHRCHVLTTLQGHSIRRLRGVVTITLNESKYEKQLSKLRERNNDLSELRSQIDALRKQAKCSTAIIVQHKPLPTRFCAVQNTSKQLHTALHEIWHCGGSAQRAHYAKICLDAEVADEVRLDLAISCQEVTQGTASR